MTQAGPRSNAPPDQSSRGRAATALSRTSPVALIIALTFAAIALISAIALFLVPLFRGDGAGEVQDPGPLYRYDDVELTIGDCFEGMVSRYEELTPISCDEPHSGELIYAFNLPTSGDAYPGPESIDALADMGCDLAWEQVVVNNPNTDDYNASTFIRTPDEDEWAEGARTVQCIATERNGRSDIVGSLTDGTARVAE